MLLKKDNDKTFLFKGPIFRVAEQIFNFPQRVFHIRLLEKETGFSTTAIIKAITELQKYDIVTIEKDPLTTNVKANLESDAYRFYKTIFNLLVLKRIELISSIALIYKPEAIVLFGSAAKGEDIVGSDIDLLIISSRRVFGVSGSKDVQDAEREMNRKINFHILTSLAKSSKEFKNAVANGIVLHGYLKVI